MDVMNTTGVTREWLDEFLRLALPEVMKKCREAKPPVVADLVRLVELDRKLFPVKQAPRQVIWVDNLDAAA
jgi:hypothetical protein